MNSINRKSSSRSRRLLGILVGLIMCVAIGFGALYIANPLRRNEQAFSENVKALASVSEEREIALPDLTPFEWDTAYSFAPYTTKDKMESVLGFASPHLKESISEGMYSIVFTKDEQVVCNVCNSPANLGYFLDFALESFDDSRTFMRVYSGDDSFILKQDMNIPHLVYKAYEFEGVIQTISGSTALIAIESGEAILRSGDQVYISLSDDLLSRANVGDKVTVKYDGIVQETFPLQLPGQMGVTLHETSAVIEDTFEPVEKDVVMQEFAKRADYTEIDCVVADDSAYGLIGVVQFADDDDTPCNLAFVEKDGYYSEVGFGDNAADDSVLEYIGNGIVTLTMESEETGEVYQLTVEYSRSDAGVNFKASSNPVEQPGL